MSQTLTLAEWRAEAERRFGSDPKNWKFRCPCCHTVQSATDFIQLKADPNYSYQHCIGRELPRDQRASNFASTPATKTKKNSPCDYAAYGLFRAIGENAYFVTPEQGGEPVPVLPFAEVS